MIFVGVDWAENSHSICVMDDGGEVISRRSVPDNPQGLTWLHTAIEGLATQADNVFIAVESDHGLFVDSLIAAGYQVYAVNPLSVSRYRDRHSTSRQKSDPGDAKLLADLVRTDRHNHRLAVKDSETIESLRVVTRAHKQLIQERIRLSNRLRNTLHDYYPAAILAFSDFDAPDVLELLHAAPTPLRGRKLSLSKIAAALRRAHRHNVDERAAEIQRALRSTQLERGMVVNDAYDLTAQATIDILQAINRQIGALEAQIAELYETHPEAELYNSLPGLGKVLGPRILSGFGDVPERYTDSKSRKCVSGMAPVTRASGQGLVRPPSRRH